MFLKLYLSVLVFNLISPSNCYYGKIEDKTKCPVVKPTRNFQMKDLLGQWYVQQYYASSEEDLAYKCMRAEFTEEDPLSGPQGAMETRITMNFTYIFINDPMNEVLVGNITWQIPDAGTPSHWVHAEDTYEGVYNTYVLDTDYTTWSLLMHCAEKERSPRYLSAFVMSRAPTVAKNVVSYLRDKLSAYGVALEYVFAMSQADCDAGVALTGVVAAPPLVSLAEEAYNGKKNGVAGSSGNVKKSRRRHPLKRVHAKQVTTPPPPGR